MKKTIAVILAVLLMAQTDVLFASAQETENTEISLDTAISETAEYLLENPKNDWEVIALLKSGAVIDDLSFTDEYYSGIVTKLQETKSPVLSGDEDLLTDNSKAILVLSSMGINCRNIEGYDIVEPLKRIEGIKVQGINSGIYALLALDSGKYTTSDSETRDKLIDYILSEQIENGSWAFSKIWSPNGDVDMTAMAVQALAPYLVSRQDVKTAVEKAVSYMSEQQQENGGYVSFGTESCETAAQVIIALTSLGINPETSEEFTKSQGNLLDNLLGFYVKGGGFSHTKGGSVNQMATVQAMLAMDSCKLMEKGLSLYYSVPEMVNYASEKSKEYLLQNISLKYNDEWAVFALARLGEDVVSTGTFDGYVADVKAKIAQTGPVLNTDSGFLTDNARVIIALTSLGIDCTDIDGINIVEPLSNLDIIKEQGVNSAIYALLALNTAKYSTSDKQLNEKLVEYILSERLENGTWAYSVVWSPNGDIDLTAMAVQALAPYMDTNQEVKAAVETAMNFLKDEQTEFGYYAAFGNASSSSTAQVVCALQELGRDSLSDSDFTVSNVSVLDSLLAFASNNGGFSSKLASNPDAFSTTQAMYALTSVIRSQKGMTSLYDMTDVLDKSAEILYGDADGNGRVNILDATLVQKYLAEIEVLSENGKAAADMDRNGVINILDATAIQKAIVNEFAA